ncbi:hypothetical protein NRY68_17825 [Acidithiobacillus ferrooxidans]|uniref:hypothetical protein n=1 Tax=Acidithiobacillus ferrooxidans TaxID=920 RepID=UPI0021485228|nr:hypothetical protein [Acidithiobacillus ferrooxidans]MCR1347614.1 hypothetical protein [Acidithiobacillus ferrooxidans]MCR1355388.1 hypothetical protein [Acidithiobacillus ferrooxidans]
MNGQTLENMDLVTQVPGSLSDIEGRVFTEMSCLGANLLHVYEPPRDVFESDAEPVMGARVMFWDFPGLSQAFFRKSRALALFLPVRWVLREEPLGIWLHTTIPKVPKDAAAGRVTDAILLKLAENLQTAFSRVCEERYPAIPSRFCD